MRKIKGMLSIPLNRISFVLGLLFVTTVGPMLVSAQPQNFRHYTPLNITRGVDNEIVFQLVQGSFADVTDAIFFYKYDNLPYFEQMPAEISANEVVVNFNPDRKNANTLTYYLNVILNDGRVVQSPLNYPEDEPFVTTIVNPGDKDAEVPSTGGLIDYTVLSPLPGETLRPEDALVAITLFYNEGEVDPDSMRVYFNDMDVTEFSSLSPYFISYAPKNLPIGEHKVELAYVQDGKELRVVKWNFSASNRAENVLSASGGQSFNNNSLADGQLELMSRTQQIFGVSEDIYTGRLILNGRQGKLKYSLNGLLTSQESNRLQPQNRYGIELAYDRIFELQAGHIFPTLNPLILAGNRVFGVNSKISLLWRNIQIQGLYGEMRRSITNIYNPVEVLYPDASGFNAIGLPDTTYRISFDNNGVGSFRREVLGARVAFGNGKYIQLGLNALRLEDDTTSLQQLNTFDKVNENRPELLSNLSAQERTFIIQNPDKFQPASGAARPQANFMFAGDLAINMLWNRVRLRSDVAASLVNNDISSGVLNSERAADIGLDLPDNISDLLEELTALIIINENMSYFPLQIVDGEVSEQRNRLLFFDDVPVPTSLLASQNTLSLNVLRNNINVQYQWIGPEYRTLSNTTIRRDIAGLSVSDRIRLFNNQIYVTLGYEDLYDNLANTKQATTNTRIYRSDLGWFPLNRKLPRISVGYKYVGRDNGIQRQHPTLSGADLLFAVRNVDANESILPTPRNSITHQINSSISKQVNLGEFQNDLIVSFSQLVTTDDRNAFGDYTNYTYMGGVNTRWGMLPLNTSINFNYITTEGSSKLTNIEIYGLNVGAKYFLFDNKVNLYADVAWTANTIQNTPLGIDDNGTENDLLDDLYFADFANTTESDQNTYIFRGGATYNITKNHALLFDGSYTNVQSKSALIGLPSDYLFQLRYVYRF